MNRRTFLKSVGAVATVGVVGLPAVAKAEKPITLYNIDMQGDFCSIAKDDHIIYRLTPEWVSFTNHLPAVGQKVLIAMRANSYHSNIRGGVIKESTYRHHMGDDYVTVNMQKDFDQRDFGASYALHNGYREPRCCYYSMDGLRTMTSRHWLQTHGDPLYYDCTGDKQERDHGACFRKTSYLWLAVNGDYPQTIPLIPTDKVIFVDLQDAQQSTLNPIHYRPSKDGKIAFRVVSK